MMWNGFESSYIYATCDSDTSMRLYSSINLCVDHPYMVEAYTVRGIWRLVRWSLSMPGRLFATSSVTAASNTTRARYTIRTDIDNEVIVRCVYNYMYVDFIALQRTLRNECVCNTGHWMLHVPY